MNGWMDLGRHGQRVQRAQSDQAIALLHRMGRLKDPTLVAGDFNSTRDAALHVGLRRHLTDTWERAGLGLAVDVLMHSPMYMPGCLEASWACRPAGPLASQNA